MSQRPPSVPGAKQVFRRAGLVDTIGLRDQPAPPASRRLLEPVMAGGRALAPRDPLGAARARFEADLAELPVAAQDLIAPVAPVAQVSAELARLEEQVSWAGRHQTGVPRRRG